MEPLVSSQGRSPRGLSHRRSPSFLSASQRRDDLLGAIYRQTAEVARREATAIAESFQPVITEAEDVAAGNPAFGFDGAPNFPPMAPGSEFGVGHAARFANEPLQLLDDAAATRTPVVGMRFRNRRAVLLNDAELANGLFADTDLFARGAAGGGGTARRSFVGSGLIASEGELWRRQRRTMNPSFTMEAVQRYAPDFVECAERSLASSAWRFDGGSTDVHEACMALTMDVACTTLFSADVQGEQEELGAAIGDVFGAAADSTRRTLFFLPQWVTLPSEAAYDRAYDLLASYLDALVAKRRGEELGEAPDLLGVLLASRDAETGEPMPASLLRDEMMTLFVAGHETTALTLTWSLCLLAKHPDALGAALEEVDAIAGQATAGDATNLRFLRNVVLESLRLYPPAFLNFRSLRRDAVIAGWELPERTFVMVSPYLLHRDPAVWGAGADEFRPERWETIKPSGPKPGAFVPFGGGERTCIGSAFAVLESQLVLATILKKCRPDPIATMPAAKPAVTLRPAENAARLVFTRR